jgi:hypothetical protein
MPFVNLYPNPLNMDEVLNIEKSEALNLLSVTNDSGQSSSIEKLKQGSYILQFADEKANTVTKRLIVK